MGGHEGDEPPASVLIMIGDKEIEGICVAGWGWTGILMSKDRRHNLRMEIVEGADQFWSGCHHRIGEITENWLGERRDVVVRCSTSCAMNIPADFDTNNTSSTCMEARLKNTFDLPLTWTVCVNLVNLRFSGLPVEPFRSPCLNRIAGLKLLGLSFSLPGASNERYSRVSKRPRIFQSLTNTMHRQFLWQYASHERDSLGGRISNEESRPRGDVREIQ